jgi:hypothetical protein
MLNIRERGKRRGKGKQERVQIRNEGKKEGKEREARKSTDTKRGKERGEGKGSRKKVTDTKRGKRKELNEEGKCRGKLKLEREDGKEREVGWGLARGRGKPCAEMKRSKNGRFVSQASRGRQGDVDWGDRGGKR